MHTRLRVGVDLDNTVVCYDHLFHRLASERGVIPDNLPATKDAVRTHLCQHGMEPMWTAMQGEAYGPGMPDAAPFCGVDAFVARCVAAGASLFVVSYRSVVPFAGPAYDLHAAARRWLVHTRAFASLDGACVHLETSLRAKLQRIRALELDYFIDDQPGILLDPEFPRSTTAVHFDPHRRGAGAAVLRRAESWGAVCQLIFGAS